MSWYVGVRPLTVLDPPSGTGILPTRPWFGSPATVLDRSYRCAYELVVVVISSGAPLECLYANDSWKPPGDSGSRMRATSLIVFTFGRPVTSNTIAPRSLFGPPCWNWNATVK